MCRCRPVLLGVFALLFMLASCAPVGEPPAVPPSSAATAPASPQATPTAAPAALPSAITPPLMVSTPAVASTAAPTTVPSLVPTTAPASTLMPAGIPTGTQGAPTSAATSAAATGQAGPHVIVEMKNYVFVPKDITISAGTTVTWRNDDDTTHTATADDKVFDSGNMGPGAQFSYIFVKPGVYPYYCIWHGAPGGQGMSGRVTVK